MSKLKLEPTVIVKTHSQSRESIAFEAQFIANAVELAKSYLPAIFSNFKSEIKNINLEEKDSVKLSKHFTTMVTIIDKTKYTDISNLTLPVCEGFESNLLTAFDKVEEILDLMAKYEGYIKDFHNYVAVFLTNKDAKKNTVDLSRANKKIEDEINKLKDILNTIFKQGNSDNTLEYSKLFSNNQEFRKAVYKYVDLDKKISKDVNVSQLKFLIEDTAENLDSIINLLKSDKIEQLSPECTKSLSEGTYQIALVAEAYSVAYFKVLAIMNIVPGFENYITENLINKK